MINRVVLFQILLLSYLAAANTSVNPTDRNGDDLKSIERLEEETATELEEW